MTDLLLREMHALRHGDTTAMMQVLLDGRTPRNGRWYARPGRPRLRYAHGPNSIGEHDARVRQRIQENTK